MAEKDPHENPVVPVQSHLDALVDAEDLRLQPRDLDALRKAVRQGREHQARALATTHSTRSLRATLEHEKLRTALIAQVGLQENLVDSMGDYMRAISVIAEELRMRVTTGETKEMTTKELVGMARDLKRLVDPIVELATARTKLDEENTLSVTASTVNMIVAAANQVRAKDG